MPWKIFSIVLKIFANQKQWTISIKLYFQKDLKLKK